jgi:hypothetical protein
MYLARKQFIVVIIIFPVVCKSDRLTGCCPGWKRVECGIPLVPFLPVWGAQWI